MQEEVFGPVIPIMQFGDFEEGSTLANDSTYGLAAYLFTNDMNRILRAVRDMEVGELYINRGPGESIHGFHARLEAERHRRRRRQVRTGRIPATEDRLHPLSGMSKAGGAEKQGKRQKSKGKSRTGECSADLQVSTAVARASAWPTMPT